MNEYAEGNNWKAIGNTYYKKPLEWPLHIQITNDPINNKVYYNCYLIDKTLSVTYTTSCITNKPFDIY